MEILWGTSGREVTGREVADLLPGYAYTTVATVLDRLHHKGLVQRRKEGRTIRFTVTGTPAAHTAMLMHEVLETTSDPEGALACFAEIMSHSEANALRRAFEERSGPTPASTGE
jgi:predicted transcriptional regulator